MRQMLLACVLAVATATMAARAEDTAVLPPLHRQPTPEAVLAEHFAALNRCDWNGLLAQYPDDAQINLPGGAIVRGRPAIGDLFAGFCKDHREGGLAGIQFAPEHSTQVGDTFATQWVATAPFLAEPYRGSDAYITHDGLMQAMVSTFDGMALKLKP